MQHKSLSKKLLTKVLSVYFLLTLIVTIGQIVADYFTTKEQINRELTVLQHTFAANLTRAIWELNTQQAITIADGLLTIPVIAGVIVRDEYGSIITEQGQSIDITRDLGTQLTQEGVHIAEKSSGLFGYSFPLIFEFSGRSTQVGDVTLFSSNNIILERIKVGLYVLLANAFIKSMFLIILFLAAFRQILTLPLGALTQQIEDLELAHLQDAKITLAKREPDELTVMAGAYNRLIWRVQNYKQQLEQTQAQLLQSNEKLDLQNLMLEQEVAKKTASLSKAMVDLQHQKLELETKQKTLREEIDLRRTTEDALRQKHRELEKSVEGLQKAQDRLIQSERMAALGTMVTGITQELQAPIDLGITEAHFLIETFETLKKTNPQDIPPHKVIEFIKETAQSVQRVQEHLQHASNLLTNYRHIAATQAGDGLRTLNLSHYLQDIAHSVLLTKSAKDKHHIEINCPTDLTLTCNAGALSQIITNLVLNSFTHSSNEMEHGLIRITVLDEGDTIELIYEDTCGSVLNEQIDKLFNPFAPAKTEEASKVLGMQMVYNLVRQTLQGRMDVLNKQDQGLAYIIRFAKNLKIFS